MLKSKNNEITNNIKKVAIMTSGGDAPGMNMILVCLLRFLYKDNYQVTIIYEGIKGLLNDEIVDFDYNNFIDFTDCIYDSGTVIRSSRVKDFYKEEKQDLAIRNLKKHHIELLIVIGGDGSYHAANCLSKKGIKVITIPATIDNDVASSEYTIGFYSALNFVYEYIKAIRNTAKSFGSFCLIEVMGNQCSDLSLYAAISSLADTIITKDNA
ncbi:6-phosphofructokinase [bacterium]|nr:6-phosphofructokinase [bacterium]